MANMTDLESMSEAGRAAFERAQRRMASSKSPLSAGLRAENEDDDGYDPYPDYMDALARSEGNLFEADPWN